MSTGTLINKNLDPKYESKRLWRAAAHWVVLILSLALIIFISYDTFQNINFLENRLYMNFQFWVCMVFLADFFFEWRMAPKGSKRYYLATHWFFFLISVPWLNIAGLANDNLSAHTLYFLRFVPLVRGAYSLALVVGAVSSNRALNLLASYACILTSIIYFASLIFYEQEYPVNSDVTDYWSALWWAGMNVTTIGCYISPMTMAGKICGVTLAACGMLMLPLFTVFVSNRVKEYNDRRREQEKYLRDTFIRASRPEEAGQSASSPSSQSSEPAETQ